METFQANDWIDNEPVVPFHKEILNVFQNKSVIIKGAVPIGAKRFYVNLCKNKDVDSTLFSTIHFHFNPRFDQKKLVMNNKADSKWNKKEEITNNPLIPGAKFEIEIFVTFWEFLISFDHYHFCRFVHRDNITTINYLAIEGDVTLSSVEYKLCIDTYPSSVRIDSSLNTLPKLRSPVLYYFINGFLRNTIVEIKGTLQKGYAPDKYSINLCTSWGSAPDYALHISPRPNTNYVACNIKCDGKWGDEEKNCLEKGCPFAWNKDFILKISYDNKFFVVHHNGKEIFKFYERIPISKIISLLIINIKVSRISVKNEKQTEEPAAKNGLSFSNLDVPFKRELAEPLTFKSDIIFLGRVKKKAIRFAINFGLEGSGIGFHFNPRFDQNYVARNHLVDGEWGVEESHSHNRNPLRRGEDFAVEIFITTHSYMVCINGRHFCEFFHRVPVFDVKKLSVEGDVELKQILLSTKNSYPNIERPITTLPAVNEVYSRLSLEMGNSVEVYGYVKLLPQVWIVNLESGGGVVWPHPNIPLHVSVRYSPRDKVVFNSWRDTGWGSEECIALPTELSPGTRFKLTLGHSSEHFLVSVNNAPLFRFKHRLEPSSVDTLYIRGDIIIDRISTLQEREKN